MAETKKVLLTHTAKMLNREELAYMIPERLKAASENEALAFTIAPVGVGEEFTTVMETLSKAMSFNQCNGKVGSMEHMLRAEHLEDPVR